MVTKPPEHEKISTVATKTNAELSLPLQIQLAILELEKIAGKSDSPHVVLVVELWDILYKHNTIKAWHSLLVAYYAKKIDEFYKSGLNTDDIFLAGLLHDIGQVKTPVTILDKAGKLSISEYLRVKTHVQDGKDMLKEKGLNNYTIEEAIGGHHENWDGSGYPNKYKEEQTSYVGRLFKIADQFEAMHNLAGYTSRKYQKEPFSLEETLLYIKTNMGTHFDPGFTSALAEFENWYINTFESNHKA
ncbi:hypothetical protein A2415_02205 [candidate division WWE3 bacterium RIFOXYC1_FULL_39_7]|uniref:HD-GYP domain-containing protein n=2 Tax=Katanobacteria TaxID=422282 RepID=A0A1F4X917_UNCKA|nr:MAG: hypothetical protein A2415_02205 [candidate division WWE3 bacterium RIFOXYC1_FULL_39_7]OGC78174.1 MAG: hypothetical protein A2619_01795 [candidate division WWE3 bacterium RIFOXYD1_FULL_39_9]